jgi:hypothetical protein
MVEQRGWDARRFELQNIFNFFTLTHSPKNELLGPNYIRLLLP